MMGRVWNFKQGGQRGLTEKLTSEQRLKVMRKEDITLLKERAGKGGRAVWEEKENQGRGGGVVRKVMVVPRSGRTLAFTPNEAESHCSV